MQPYRTRGRCISCGQNFTKSDFKRHTMECWRGIQEPKPMPGIFHEPSGEGVGSSQPLKDRTAPSTVRPTTPSSRQESAFPVRVAEKLDTASSGAVEGRPTSLINHPIENLGSTVTVSSGVGEGKSIYRMKACCVRCGRNFEKNSNFKKHIMKCWKEPKSVPSTFHEPNNEGVCSSQPFTDRTAPSTTRVPTKPFNLISPLIENLNSTVTASSRVREGKPIILFSPPPKRRNGALALVNPFDVDRSNPTALWIDGPLDESSDDSIGGISLSNTSVVCPAWAKSGTPVTFSPPPTFKNTRRGAIHQDVGFRKRCPLCPPSKKKEFRSGVGLRMHMKSQVHVDIRPSIKGKRLCSGIIASMSKLLNDP